MKENTCCFSGHRRLPKDKLHGIILRLDRKIDDLIGQGVTDFISGGALGFDQIAASLIIAKKEMGRDIRLIFALPCKNQDKRWSDEQKRLYRSLLSEADEVVHVSEDYFDGCMEKRNRWMVDKSAYCVCALAYPRSGTGQTVRYEIKKMIHIFNVLK